MKIKLFILILIGIFYMQGCLPDRMAPKPIEMNRPEFVAFNGSDSSGLNISLDHNIFMHFNESMEPSSFKNNFILESVSGQINGSFKISDTSSNVVVFIPGTNMNPAEKYLISIFGGVRDKNGNSMVSPVEEDVPQTNWFFTTGEYADNGFPYIFVTDRVDGGKIYQVGEINKFLDSDTVAEASSEMRISPDGTKLFISNRLSAGTVSIVDPSNLNSTNISVGTGPDHLYVTTTKAFVVNASEATVSVIDIASQTVENTFGFTDNFRPADIVVNSTDKKIYISSGLNSDYDRIRVVDENNVGTWYDITGVLPERKTKDVEISPDGKYLFLADERTNLIIIDTSADTVLNSIVTDYVRNEDGLALSDAYYLSTTGGALYKINYNTFDVESVLEFDGTITTLSATAAEEMLYVVSPTDSMVKIIETSTFTEISKVKVPGSLKNIAVSISNYQ